MLKAVKRVQAGESHLQDRAEFLWIGGNLILVLADGAGGMGGGAEAAEFVVRRVKGEIIPVVPDAQRLVQLLVSIDLEMAATEAYGETTCVVMAISDDRLVGASVGDSGAWRITESGVENLTVNQRRKPFLGSGRAMPVGFELKAFAGTLLVASDGLLKYASIDSIASTALLPSLEQAAENLIRLVRYPSGAFPDDVSVILVRKE